MFRDENRTCRTTGLPFSGFKQSGIARELGTLGLEAYLEPKSVLGIKWSVVS